MVLHGPVLTQRSAGLYKDVCFVQSFSPNFFIEFIWQFAQTKYCLVLDLYLPALSRSSTVQVTDAALLAFKDFSTQRTGTINLLKA
jgi:hypothetical protein